MLEYIEVTDFITQVMGKGQKHLRSEQESDRIRLNCSPMHSTVFIEGLLRGRHCSRSSGYIGEQRQNSCPHRVQMPIAEKALQQQ